MVYKVQRVKKAIIISGIVGLLITGMGGCAGRNPADTSAKAKDSTKGNSASTASLSAESVDISFWNVFTGPDGKYMQQIVEEFNKENQGRIKVRVKVYSAAEYYNKITPAAASGTAPDTGIMHINRLYQFASKGILSPLDELAQKLSYTEQDFEASVWRMGVMEGKRYAIPLDIHPVGLYYNVKLLKEAGYANPPKTMEEFINIARACTKDNNGDGKPDVWGYATTKGMNANIFLTFLYQLGGKFIAEDGSTPAYDSPEGEQALQLLADLIHTHKVCPANISPDDDVVLFKNNKLALYMNGVWMISEFRAQKDLDFEVAPVPLFGKQRAVWADAHNLVMFKQRKADPKKTEAAGEFISYLLKNSLGWAKAGQVPARNSVRESAEFRQLKDQYSFSRQEKDIVFNEPTVNYDIIWSPLDAQVKNVLLGISKPKDALKAAAEKAEENVKDSEP